MGQMSDGMKMDNSMMRFFPLLGMWLVMMAAMMFPTMVPTLKSYEDLMSSADGTRIGWLGLLVGYSLVSALGESISQRFNPNVLWSTDRE